MSAKATYRGATRQPAHLCTDRRQDGLNAATPAIGRSAARQLGLARSGHRSRPTEPMPFAAQAADIARALGHNPDRLHDRTSFRVGTGLRSYSSPAPLGAEGAHAVVKVLAESRLTRAAGVVLPFVAAPAGLLVRQARSTRGGAVVERRGRQLPVCV